MALAKLQSTSEKGVFYRTEPGRKHGVRADRQFVIVYKLGGRKYRGVVGWESERAENGGPLFTVARCRDKIMQFRRNYLNGSGPFCLEDERKLLQREREEKEAAERARLDAEKNRPTITRLWQLYTESNPGIKGIGSDRNRFNNYLLSSFGEKTPEQICTLDLDRLRLAMIRGEAGPRKKPLSPQSVKHVLILLRRIIRYGVQRKLCSPPDLTFTMPKVDNQLTEHLTQEQLSRLLAALEDEPDKTAVAIVKLALLAGLRKGEMLSLEWKDVDLDRGLLRIANPKGGISATIPLSKSAVEVLQNLPRAHQLVFPGRDGKQRHDIKRPLARIRKAAGLPEKFRPLHGLRHHYASTLASSGKVDLYTLQKLLNHKDPATTQRYAHLCDKTLRSATSVAEDSLNLAPTMKIST